MIALQITNVFEKNFYKTVPVFNKYGIIDKKENVGDYRSKASI